MSPGAFPAYSLLSAFGRAAPLNLDYQRSGRVLPFPFHFLNNNGAMNVRPANYSWQRLYDLVLDLTRYSFSTRAIFRRLLATEGVTSRWMNVVRAVSTEGFGRARYHREIRRPPGHRPAIPALFRAGEQRASPVLQKHRAPGSRTADGVASRGRSLSRSQRLLEGRALQGCSSPRLTFCPASKDGPRVSGC